MFNLLMNPPKICFIHVPKCGGTYVGELLKKQYAAKKLYKKFKSVNIDAKSSKHTALFFDEEVQYFRNKLASYYLNKKNLDFFEGHVSLGRFVLSHYANTWSFLSLIRDPVSRFFSQYFYASNKESDHEKIYLTLDEWIKSYSAKNFGMLYTNYFAYELNNNKFNVSDKINRAKENMYNYYHIGFTENIKQFIAQNNLNIFSRLSYRISFTRTNKNPIKNYMRSVTEVQRRKVEELCKPDIEIYNWARNIYI